MGRVYEITRLIQWNNAFVVSVGGSQFDLLTTVGVVTIACHTNTIGVSLRVQHYCQKDNDVVLAGGASPLTKSSGSRPSDLSILGIQGTG